MNEEYIHAVPHISQTHAYEAMEKVSDALPSLNLNTAAFNRVTLYIYQLEKEIKTLREEREFIRTGKEMKQ